jgi:putative membrane protein
MNGYDWLRAFHIIAVIAWMAGLLMYPRLLVYRLEGRGVPELETAMDQGAHRLKRIILNPAMILTWILGIGLISTNFGYYAGQIWFWGKLILVIGLSGFHGYILSLGRKVASGDQSIAPRRLRMMNEIPMVISIFAVLLVVVQPFST